MSREFCRMEGGEVRVHGTGREGGRGGGGEERMKKGRETRGGGGKQKDSFCLFVCFHIVILLLVGMYKGFFPKPFYK